MRKEILDIVYRMEAEGKIVSPIADIGGQGTEYQKEQGYDFRKYFTEKGYNYYIVDKVHREGVDYPLNAINMVLTKTIRPNTILLTEVLEHCEDPIRVVDRCVTNMKTGGYILVTAPDVYGEHSPEDYWRFTQNGLRLLCKRLEIVEIGEIGSRKSGYYEHYLIGRKTNG